MLQMLIRKAAVVSPTDARSTLGMVPRQDPRSNRNHGDYYAGTK